jgi:hypothetical protein
MVAQQTQHARHLIRSFLHSNHSFGFSHFGERPRRWPGVVFARVFKFVLILSFMGGLSVAQASPITGAITESVMADPTSATLRVKYQQLNDKLEHSVFGEPLVLDSKTTDGDTRGEVYAVVNVPFARLNETMSDPMHWCQLTILHVNIKACTYHDEDRIKLYVGRKFYQTPSQAYAIEYRFQDMANNDHHLNVKLTAPTGPFGTSDYLIHVEAIPLDEQHSFLYLEYRYHFGFTARMAMKTYLLTIGRNKVGFTETGVDDNGAPILVQGLQGVVERNVMRYLYAIQSVLEASQSKLEYQQTARLVRWYALITRHPKQLYPFSREEYLQEKHKEIANQQALQVKLQ